MFPWEGREQLQTIVQFRYLTEETVNLYSFDVTNLNQFS